MKMTQGILWQALQTGQGFSENKFVKENKTGAFLGGSAAIAAGVALGVPSLPLTVPILVISGMLAGLKGEETVKGIGSIFGEVAKGITAKISEISDAFKSDEYFFNRGVKKLENKQCQEAIEDFTQAININSQYNDVYFYRADAYISLENYNSAIHDLNHLIKIKPKH